ncbi:MAG: DUF262 domain-containing protein [Myroides sp.]|uniref:DUF262 domain-containing protein n=1 Tax=Flavobacteriales TaxID=200644 RepID=UPI000EFC4256|nr:MULTISPECIES: DUF262 domain-containing protein [Flavobacteriales]MDC8026864.1 DUF262 domain-containing protein [Elizabethkingia anophelis]MDV3491619.1 hypothetical protein [Elizabethkingia anophelis]MDV3873709.1 hypothetical protein [Elizabethkingia anophelis]MDV4087460.1 hypothetical protein [Elizabethkingia anophelis]
MNNNISTKPISELLGMSFFIPAYQRGYRWEEQQIIDLLNDILEFQKKKDKGIGEFYCLQPLIVTQKENEVWEVVDGQQRLTSVYILLSYLSTKGDYGIPTDLFSIEYETREKDNYSSRQFLKDITLTTELNKTNIDFYRMSDAFLTIKQWFEENKPTIGKFVDTLISHEPNENDDDEANNIRFIWYPININSDTKEKPNVTFAKYNQGKIDLTNAELIKAIFYLTDSDKDKKKHQIKIGYEWDDIENTLRKKDFWHFINPSKSYLNHIEFIFDLVATKYEKQTNPKINKNLDRYWSFHVFNDLILKNIKIYEGSKFSNTRDFLWDEIKTYYRTFVEWYSNKDEENKYIYFHLIGFLLQVGGAENTIEKVKELAETNSKSQFVKELQEKIKSHFDEIDFNEIGYDDNTKKAKEILLLFNVITTMNGGFNKFSFDRISSWSLEHIHAQLSEEITNEKDKRQLLEEQKNDFFIFKQAELSKEIIELLAMPDIDQTRFVNLQKEIFDLSSDAGSTIHSIKNLALLTPSDNSSLNNSPFHRKRDKIKLLDEKGSFIPICTKNVFLKYYSKNVEQNVKWDKKDMDAYLAEMKSVLTDYVKIKKEYYGE